MYVSWGDFYNQFLIIESPLNARLNDSNRNRKAFHYNRLFDGVKCACDGARNLMVGVRRSVRSTMSMPCARSLHACGLFHRACPLTPPLHRPLPRPATTLLSLTHIHILCFVFNLVRL